MKYRKLEEYLEKLRSENLVKETLCFDSSDIEIRNVSYNSKEVVPGTLFICKGINFKREYLLDAVEKGAVAYMAEKDLEVENLPCIIVNNMRLAISRVSALFFGKTWAEGLKLIGLTGTKGKSTTATMIKSIMDIFNGREIGFSSGIYTYDGAEKLKSRKLTTPETIELHRILDNCVANDCRYLAMEVSSQGLKYDRVADLDYEVCGFTNISEDHISDAEHSDMEDYFTSKLRIFEKSRIACINTDMDPAYYERVLKAAEENCEIVVKFGFDETADIRGDRDVCDAGGVLQLKAYVHGKVEEFVVNIGGTYNAYNALCAIAVTDALGVPADIIREGLKNVRVAGRMEHYKLDDSNVDIIVDCAHNRMSYEALFSYARNTYPEKKVGFLFGCVGDKAFNRRKEAAEIADANADFIMITERDPGKEDVNKICSEIMDGIAHKEKAEIETDRDLAVEKILERAEEMKDCVVLLCGCGSDAYVKRGTQLVEFATDGERVQKYILERKAAL